MTTLPGVEVAPVTVPVTVTLADTAPLTLVTVPLIDPGFVPDRRTYTVPPSAGSVAVGANVLTSELVLTSKPIGADTVIGLLRSLPVRENICEAEGAFCVVEK